jgi:hypothetical protein
MIEKVVDEICSAEDRRGDLRSPCEKLREPILDDRMPHYLDNDRPRMMDNSEALAASGDWSLDSGPKKPSPRCPVLTEGVEDNHIATPENSCVPATKDSPEYISPPLINDTGQLKM